MEETTTGRHENQPYESTPLENSGVGLDGFNHTFNNKTALRLLAIADPSFPKLLPLAANMTRRLHTIQAHARTTAAESIALISSIVRQDPRSQAASSGGDESRDRLARQWTGGFDFHRWWSGDATRRRRHGSAAARPGDGPGRCGRKCSARRDHRVVLGSAGAESSFLVGPEEKEAQDETWGVRHDGSVGDPGMEGRLRRMQQGRAASHRQQSGCSRRHPGCRGVLCAVCGHALPA